MRPTGYCHVWLLDVFRLGFIPYILPCNSVGVILDCHLVGVILHWHSVDVILDCHLVCVILACHSVGVILDSFSGRPGICHRRKLFWVRVKKILYIGYFWHKFVFLCVWDLDTTITGLVNSEYKPFKFFFKYHNHGKFLKNLQRVKYLG